MKSDFAQMALCLFVAANASAQVFNPGFETAGAAPTNALNWSVTTAAGGPVQGVRANDNPHSGAYNFEVHLASNGGGPVVEFMQAGVPVMGGTNYPFTFYADALAGGLGFNAQWRIQWNNGADTGYQNYIPGNNTYSLISNSVTAPLTATSATIYLHFAGAAATNLSATIDVDDVSLSPGSNNTNTFPVWTAGTFVSQRVRGFNEPGDISDLSLSNLAATGANVVRYSVNLSPNTGNITNATAYTYDLAPLTTVVAAAAQYGFKVVVTLDGASFSTGFFTGAHAASLQASVAGIWAAIATQLNGNAAVAAFDLLNEPVAGGGTDYLTAVATNLVNTIRAVDPGRVIIFEPQPYAMSYAFATLTPLPFTNVVYSFHTYAPYEIVYQGIPGNGYYTQETYPSPSTADIGAVNISNLASAGNGLVGGMDLDPVVAFQQKYDVPIYVGEFSCIRWAPISPINGQPTANNYISDAITLFESHGWSWTYHAWRQYYGWDAEVPESFFFQWSYTNAYPNIPGGNPYSWPEDDYSSVRSDSTDTMLLLKHYFSFNQSGSAIVIHGTIAGGNLILTGNGGIPGGSYTWLTSPKLAASMTAWTTNGIGTFNSNGAFFNAIPVTISQPAVFLVLRVP